MQKYDVVVLGAGPGGYVSAIRAAQLGASVAIVEKQYYGGTCLNVGCIPTKALVRNAEIIRDIQAGKSRGIKIDGELVLDYKKGKKAKDKACRQLVNGVVGLLAANGVKSYDGLGRVKSGKIVAVEGENGVEEIGYDKLIIATGSAPKKLPFEGIDLPGVLTSTELLELEEAPKRMVIVGGGVIGCEFATVFAAYGTELTIVEMLPAIMANQDEEVSAYMKDVLSNDVNILTGTGLEKIEEKDGALNVVAKDADGKEVNIPCDNVLISIGRQTNLAGTEELGLEMEKQFIKVDDECRTSDVDVFAIGDVTGKIQLAHVAMEMGTIAAENAMGAHRNLDLSVCPSCIYTLPEVSSVGLTEKAAREAGYDVAIGKFPLLGNGKATATGVGDGFFKIVVDAETKKILGAHLVGHTATEIIAEMAAYMKMGATADDVIGTIHSHPTISESIAEAARDVYGQTIHMPPKK